MGRTRLPKAALSISTSDGTDAGGELFANTRVDPGQELHSPLWVWGLLLYRKVPVHVGSPIDSRWATPPSSPPEPTDRACCGGGGRGSYFLKGLVADTFETRVIN